MTDFQCVEIKNSEMVQPWGKGHCVFIIGLVFLLAGCAGNWIERDKADGSLSGLPTKAISHIDLFEGSESTTVRIRGNVQLKYSSVKQSDPLGVVLFFPETGMDIDKSIILPENDFVDEIRVTELQGKGIVSKVEILLKKDLHYDITIDDIDLLIIFSTVAQTQSRPHPERTEYGDVADSVLRAMNSVPPTAAQLEPADPEPDDHAREMPDDEGDFVASYDFLSKNGYEDDDGKEDEGARIQQVRYSADEAGRLSIAIETTVPVRHEIRRMGTDRLRIILFGTAPAEPLVPMPYIGDSIQIASPAISNAGRFVYFEVKCPERTPYFMDQTDSILTIHFDPPPADALTAKNDSTATIAADLLNEIHTFLSRWKAAWEKTAGKQGDMEPYMSHYSDAFASRGLGKSGWERDKRIKNSRRSWIKGEIIDADIKEAADQKRIHVQFFLDYTSPNYSELLKKTLILNRERDGWRIIGEKSRLASPEERGKHRRPKTQVM